MDKINSAITMVLCFVIGWQCMVQGTKTMSLQSASQLLRIPKYPFVYISGIGFFLVAVAILIHFIAGNSSDEQIENINEEESL